MLVLQRFGLPVSTWRLLIPDCAGQHGNTTQWAGLGLLGARGYFHSSEHMFVLLYCLICVGTTSAVLPRPFVVVGRWSIWVLLAAMMAHLCPCGGYKAAGFLCHGTTACRLQMSCMYRPQKYIPGFARQVKWRGSLWTANPHQDCHTGLGIKGLRP